MASLVGGSAWAVFSGTSANSSNSFTAGSLTLTDDDAGAAMITLSNQKPGDTDTRCISLTYNGPPRASVVTYGATTGTALDGHIGLLVTRGTMPTGQFNTCTGFTADTRVHIPGQSAGVVYVGSLADYPDSAATAIYDSPQNKAWTDGESHAFKFQIWTGSNRLAEGKNVTQSFTWEAQSVASAYDDAVYGTTGLVSYWRLNELSGTSAADSQGSHRGDYRRESLRGQPGALTGEANKAVTLDGVDDYVDLGEPAGLRTAEFTVEAWFKTSASGTEQTIYRSRPYGQTLKLGSDGKVIGEYSDSAGTAYTSTSSASFNDGAWHHVAYTRASTGSTLYVDGNQVGSNSSTAAIHYDSDGRVRVGKNGDEDTNYFNGSIDEVAFYDNALTQTKIQEHHAAR